MEKVEQKINEAKKLLMQGDFNGCINCLSKTLEQEPNNNSVNILLAESNFSLGNFSAASTNLSVLLRFDSNSLQVLKLQFKIHHKQEQLFKAYDIIKRIIAIEPTLENKYELAIICTRIAKIDEAKYLLESYTEKVKNNAFAYLNLGHMHKAVGDFDLAEECYYKFIELEPNRLGYAIWNIADLKDRKITEKELSNWQLMEEDNKQDHTSKLLMQFSLGTALEKQKKYDKSFDYFHKANSNKNKISPFNKKAFNSFINNILSINNKDNKYNKTTNKTITPIFILGLPRSGSTLVEQILSSHESVNATDELNFIGYTAANMERAGSYAKAISELDEHHILELRQQYLDYAAEYQTCERPYFIDKNPLNFFHVGLIFKLFPEAKIVHTHRNLLDNAVSLFKRYFYVGHDYSYSMPNIITFMEGYSKVMQHWDVLFPGKIFHSQYECLVENSEKKIKSILEFCELEEQEECFTFYKQKRTVLTPSVDQVNKPINSSSINSWLRFEKQILPYKTRLISINDTLLTLGNNNEKSAWDNYWQQGYITSFGSKYVDNYIGVIEKQWVKFFESLRKKSRVLDVATGNGAVLDFAINTMRNDSKAKLTGIDYSQVKNSNSRMTLMSDINVEDLPFNNASFTHISSQYGIEYSNLFKSIPEISRVLTKSGKFQFICHCNTSVVLSDNHQIYNCTKDLLKIDGAIFILEDMLVELNNKKLTNSMDEKVAEIKRNQLNSELLRLLNKYGDVLHETMFPTLMRKLLQKNIAIAERDSLLKQYKHQHTILLVRLNDLIQSALSESDLIILKKIAENSGLGSVKITELIEPDIGVIGVVIKGVKL